MRSLFVLIFAILCLSANATTYYFSTSGNDANNGTSPSTPWQSISKFNAVFASMSPGDNFLFKRGDVFYGKMLISRSGSPGLPITIGAYGTGSNPVITGFTNVNTWTNLGSNIWESSSAISSSTTCNMVVINGVNTPMGRYPNTGYLTYQGTTLTTKTSSSLNSGVTNWTGAVAVIRKNNWITDNDTITVHSGSTITHSYHDINSYTGTINYGFFIENDARTLDAPNEWYYNPTTKKIRIYSTSAPSNVQVSTVDTLVYDHLKTDITFDNITFIGSNKDAFVLNRTGNTTIQNCSVDYSGGDAIWGGQNWGSPFSPNFKLINTTINHTNNNAINLQSEFTNASITNCTIKNGAIIPGMGKSGEGTYLGVTLFGNGDTLQNCIIDSIGYVGAQFLGNNIIIRNNVISNYDMTKMDGGGIYSWLGGGTPNTGVKIYNNIIINASGSTSIAGTTSPTSLVHGIYLDANTQNIEIYGNTCANLGYGGLYLYSGASNNNIHNNTFYNNGVNQMLIVNYFSNGYATLNNTVTNNIFFSRTTTQLTGSFGTRDALTSFTSGMGTFTGNYYSRPMDDNLTIKTLSNNYGTNASYTLSQWKTTSGNDIGSNKSPKTVANVNDIRFEYNPTSVSKTIGLGATYIDVKNVSYPGTITLPPYSSAVLILNGAVTNQSPAANAGADQSITLPTNSVTFAGSGNDSDGTISSYNWTKIAGPSSYTIVNSTLPGTSVTGLAQGVYQFQLKVTDNNGATGTDTMLVTVNPAPNQPPSANAGSDQSITLPSNTVTLSGSATDPDGTISSYNWIKISGPSSGSVTNTSSASTSVTGLVQGIYQFQLTVTDNKGATGFDVILVTVNAATNIPPIANAGANQITILPVNTVTLSGTGSDADGTIVSYLWTEISGPAGYNIVNANSPVTDIAALVQGIYQFQLTVIDNSGAIGTDIIQVTVNAAVNIPPTANAGTNQSITLPVNTVTLSGSGSDADGTVVGYTWTKISGPSIYNIVNANSAGTNVTGLVQGTYQFQLTVTDNSSAIGTDIIQVTVNAAMNIPPTSNAGLDQAITLPTNTVTLSGSGSDADGNVVSYAWTEISGPSSYNIVKANSAGTNVTGLVQGTYQFQLQVTDNNGATGTDIMQVTVNAAPNQPPVANAGLNQIITLPVNSVTLSGSGSDADGTVVSYAWTLISGPAIYNIVNANLPGTNVTSLVQGVYKFQLKVTDNNGATGTDIVQVTVNAAANIAPTANAGTDQTITLPVNTITLSGSGSDTDGTIVSYQWTKTSGPGGYNIVNANSPVTDIAGLVQGTYQFQLTVTDNSGAIGTDIIQVIVNAAVNISPIANAGTNQSITLPANFVTLSGSGSDADGTVVGYTWTEISGPSTYNIVNANSAGTNVTGLVQGTYQFQLTVTDNSGAIGTDIIQVTVNAAANIPPTSNAGLDQAITLPTNTVTLSGTGSDADGSIVSYVWTEISGPSTYNIVNANSAGTDVTGLVQGTYQFQLQVTDNNGATGTDIMQVTVNAAPNQPPVANAGVNQIITLPVNNVTLSGSGSDADGTVVSYAWTLISGPSGYNIVNANSAGTNITGLVQGTYQFQLQVTDDNGATGADIIQVTVNAAANIPPVANAGSDQIITLPVNTITLSGSSTDADGTIVSYAWTEISGPSTYNIVSANSAGTDVTGLVQGTYQFQLEVTDNNGAIGTDVIQVTVNTAGNISPVANAGLDQAITLSVNTITLSGSGSDADGSVVSYAWTRISGPSGDNIVNANSPLTDVTGLVQGTYQFQLLVTDNNGATGTDIIQVVVNAAANIPPVANSGSDQIITLPVNTVTLSGSGSDADGSVVSFTWIELSGPSTYNIVNSNSPGTDVTGLVQGTYQFQLQVTDNNGATGTDIVQVIVNAASNQPPVANAGPDQTITLPVNSVTLSGSGSDADGTVVSYTWTLISGPATYNIVNANSAGTIVNGLVQGVYQFQLQVTDNNGATGADIIQVTVNAAANIPPVANPGLDQTITLPVNTITLSGSGTDADGTVVSYAWTEISGPSTYNIVSTNSAGTDVTGLVQGIYQFQLQVTDNNGATGADIVQVIVNTAPNQPPVANAGSDQTITLPLNTITLSGSGSDADGTVVNYTWTQISGSSGDNIVSANSAGTNVTGLVQGTYQFQLQVTDNNGAVGIDIIQVIVNAAANIPPVANAGFDQSITLPTNSVTLSGNGTDVDGVVVNSVWAKISGPSAYNIIDGISFVTDVTGLVQGVYQFQLMVTDDNGATGTDTIQVTVNAANNISPVANAGSDQTITLPVNSVTLSGSGSDADGTVTSYAWTKISGPASYSIVNAASSSTNITGLAQGTYQFQLQVTDNNGATGADTMQITVNIAGNISPIANAGSDQIITLPVNTITLSGSGSDADGTVVSYAWTEISGPSTYNIVNATLSSTTVTGLVQGVYQFQLQVTDNNGATGTDVVQVTVNAAPNVAPVANAGPDQTITLPINSVTVSGSGSDSDGTVVSYLWTKISGPSSYNIVNATSAVTGINSLVKGVYKFQLKVTDNNGATGTDVIQVTVNAAPNQPPLANAGSDWTITLPTNSLTVSGSGSDADGSVVSYTWTKISGPASYSIVSPASAATAINGLVQGVYQFQLTVTDNNGATGTDIMQVTVNAAPNQPPVANAGSDQTITLPVNSVSVSGSGSDADGTVASYAWTKISGPASYTIVNPASAVTAINGLVQGVYQFQLKVTDNTGATAIDIMQVTVNAAPNVPPVANGGPDNIITLPINSLTLSGSGSDADGSVVGYQWTKISGPSGYTMVDSTSAVTAINGLVQGVYVFELTVTDNNGATGTDIMQITVNAAPNQPPVANGGSDQTITLPINSVTVSGSGSDADGTVVSYLWTKISGPGSYSIVNPALANTDITGLTQGVYQFQLKVTDNNGATGTDVIQVTVNAAPNQPPLANAGSDWTITLPTNSLTVSGSGSDADGSVVSYTWTKISGPASYSIVSPASAATAINGLVQGVYQFQLTVTDNNGATGTDIMQVTVNAAPNQPPVANAGSDQTITLPVNSVTLSGSGSDADGTVTSYAWTKISGPASYTIVNPASAITAINGLVQGVYQFQLKVTDNTGATAIDIMQVTVNAAPNVPPVANGGPDNIITLPINSLTLSGSGSDADGSVVGYQWTKISGPSGYTMVDSTSAVTAINGLVQGVYVFELTVTDNNGATGTDIMQITVNAAPNQPPVANGGSDQTITLPINSVTVSGSGSDADGTVVSYLWTKISGPGSYSIVNPALANTDITGLTQGVYQFQLKVTDNNGATGTDVIQVTVNAAPNQPPLANAGSDWTITLPTNSLTVSGSGSDADGSVVSYTWTKISGPASYSIVSPASAATAINGLVQGVYQFQLTVTDNNGATGTDIMQVTVNAAPNQPPVANAGSDQTITLPVNSVTLSGSGSDADGTVTSYAWTKISGPASYTIVNPASAITAINGLVQGVYQFQLKVTDNTGATAIDIMQVTVNAAPNVPPVSNAGSDQTITLPVNSVIVSGSGSDADGSVVGYQWTKISGPSGYTMVDSTSAVTAINGLVQGVYVFELTVTDNNGATGTDIMQITVNAAPNQPPVANGGSDQTITLPINSVTVSGSGSDADGTVVSYLWTKISGPGSYSIVNPALANTDITGLTQGVYQFQLKVTDNNGATGTDVIQVTVNAAPNQPPLANAGSDWTITLPTNSLTVSGSGSDADGSVVSYTWTKISGPASYSIVSPASAATAINGLVQGVYQFQLTVTDNNGATGTDIMQVTVNAAPNQPPVANAGSDQTITLPVNSVSVSGSGSDADGTVASYTWTKISGPASYTIVNPASAVTAINGLVQGVYQFQLKVTDNTGATAIDIMQVTVNAAPNVPPVANGGPDNIITLPINSLTLSGSGSDADGLVVGYQWTKISGPSSYNIVSPTSAVTVINNLSEGLYKFELRVTDNNGARGRDTIQVIVNAAVINKAPIANAGTDQTITLPTNTVTLSGSGTDVDGSIIGYSWKQISGPLNSVIDSSNNAVTLSSKLVGGTYEFELSVADDMGAIGRDTVSIVVAEPRINSNAQANEIKAYPNPVIDETTLEINTSLVYSKLFIIITDMKNQIVYKKEINSGQTNIKEKINLSNLIKGTYVITVYYSNNEKQSIKVIRL